MFRVDVVGLLQLQHLLHVDESENVVEVALADGQARVVRGGELLAEHAGLLADVERVDVRALGGNLEEAAREAKAYLGRAEPTN